jgi:hypothetical protein
MVILGRLRSRTIRPHWQSPGFPPRLEVLEAALYALHDPPARSSHYTGQLGAVAVQSFSTHLLSNSLRAILTHIEQTPDVPRHHPGLVEFTRTLSQYNARLNDHTPRSSHVRQETEIRHRL